MSSALSLRDVLADIPDPRPRRGIRHSLSALLGLAVLAMLTDSRQLRRTLRRTTIRTKTPDCFHKALTLLGLLQLEYLNGLGRFGSTAIKSGYSSPRLAASRE